MRVGLHTLLFVGILPVAVLGAVPDRDFDATRLVRFRSGQEAEARRDELIRLIWPSGIPAHRPQVDAAIPFPDDLAKIDSDRVQTVDRLIFDILDLGLVSHGYFLAPRSPAKSARLAIVHAGHTPQGDRERILGNGVAETIDELLALGHHVAVMQMPLYGWNDDTKGVLPDGAPFQVHRRGTNWHLPLFAQLEPALGGRIFSLFLEPVVQVTNEFVSRHPNYRDILMIGLSGGGWTTHMAAAVDPRIDISIPVAGAMPLYARPFGVGRMGDSEQFYPPIYREIDSDGDGLGDQAGGVASWLEVFALGGIGNESRPRRQIPVLNFYDSCCFYGPVFRSYDRFLHQLVAEIGGGSWELFSDVTHQSHIISATTLASVLKPAVRGEPLDNQGIVDMGSRRELFVDRHLIGNLKQVSLRLQQPIVREKVMTFPASYEGIYSGAYNTVIQDGPLYRMYYIGYPSDEIQYACYAESTNGIDWVKPNLGICEVHGSKENNVILTDDSQRPDGGFTHNFTPFLDTRPGTPPEQRFKAVGGLFSGLYGFHSADGIHWQKFGKQPLFQHEVAHGHCFDSQNIVFWSEVENTYVLYYRLWTGQQRRVFRATSDDFIHWTEGRDTDANLPGEQLYTSQTHPYYRAPHIYIAMPMRYLPGRRALSDAELKRIGAWNHPWLKNDLGESVLMTSRGGLRYQREFKQAFIRPGRPQENWLSRAMYATLNVVPTGEDEMSFYVVHHQGLPSVHLRRYTMRVDGFASVHAGHQTGELVTKPFFFSGNELRLNFASAASGGIRVEIQDPLGEPLDGYRWEDCQEIIGDRIDHVVCWKNGSDLGKLATRPIRLRLQLKDADLFSIQFQSTE